MMMMMALRMKSSFFRSIVRERENKRVVSGASTREQILTSFSPQNTLVNTRNISRNNNNNALVKGEKTNNVVLIVVYYVVARFVQKFFCDNNE